MLCAHRFFCLWRTAAALKLTQGVKRNPYGPSVPLGFEGKVIERRVTVQGVSLAQVFSALLAAAMPSWLLHPGVSHHRSRLLQPAIAISSTRYRCSTAHPERLPHTVRQTDGSSGRSRCGLVSVPMRHSASATCDTAPRSIVCDSVW